MKDLKLKIYDVLVYNISVEVFEKWLYNSEFLNEKLNQDSLVFNLININYRKENAIQYIKNIAYDFFDENDFLAMRIEDNCRKIVHNKYPENIKKYVLNIIDDFNFYINSDIYYEFYSLYHSFDGYSLAIYSKRPLDEINLRTFNYAKHILEDLESCKSLEEKKKIIFFESDEVQKQNQPKALYSKKKKLSLKQKIIAFLGIYKSVIDSKTKLFILKNQK